MYLIGPYLFSGDDLNACLEGRRAEALRALAEIPREEIAARGPDSILQSLCERFSVAHTALRTDEAFFAGERSLTEEEREAIGVAAPDAGRYKALSIVIPFTGDERLLICTPSIYSAHQPQAEVRDGRLTVTYLLNEAEEMQLENNFKRLIALIERTLEVTQWQAMGHNEKLAEALSAALAEHIRP